MTAPRKKTDHHRQAAAIRERFPQLDAAIVAAQQALDAALIAGSDTKPYRGHHRMSIQARAKADHALAAIVAEQEAERQTAIVATARVIEAKAEAAGRRLIARFEFKIEGLHA